VNVAPATGTRPPSLVIVGGSGFLGRHLVAALRDRHAIHVIARRTERGVGVEPHPNVRWTQVDVADRAHLAAAFASLGSLPRPLQVIHLAAHYDFTGRRHPDYQRTNVDGLRNVLELCRELRPERFHFASSLAACAFPEPGRALTEASPPNGSHLYAVTKRIGEEMLREYEAHFPSVIVRMAALFSDWCEYPPLYFFLRTWLSRAWNRHVLGGRGDAAIPYLHVRCAVRLYARLIEMHRELAPGEVVIASPDGCVSQRQAFEAATAAAHGRPARPIPTPIGLATLGLWGMELLGRLRPDPPFERAWMARYIDLRLNVDARRTRARTGWAPNPRLFVLGRIPFMVENLRSDPLEWQRRNLAALESLRVEPNLALYHLLADHDPGVFDASMARFLDAAAEPLLRRYRDLGTEELSWAKRQLHLQLRNAIRTADRTVFRSYCRELGARRFRQGFAAAEVVHALTVERDIVLRQLRDDPRSRSLLAAINEKVVGTFVAGIDEIQDVFEELSGIPWSGEAAVTAPGGADGRGGGATGPRPP
jgi:nucleoside-diphosphate-sugar epimerase